jgi:osmotically-inducible protein OsmY
MAGFTLLLSVSGILRAQDQEQVRIQNLANQVRKVVLSLPDYSVFDYFSFGINKGTDGYVVSLMGYTVRPTLKDGVQKMVQKIETVESVDNQIEVLPNSGRDEDIRFAAYVKIYSHTVLSRYNPNRGTPIYGSPMSFRRVIDMGISSDPPVGFHPISIIVRNGNIILEGVIDSQGHKDIAGIQAKSVSGAFSVTNNLHVLNP